MHTDPTPSRAALAAQAFLTPRRNAQDPEPLELPGAQRIVLPTDEVALAAVTAGNGPTVLLVHGWEGQAGDLAAIARSLIDTRHRVVAIDLPAHGASGGRRTSIPASARALVQAAPQLGPLQAVVAHSVGTAVVVTAMAQGLAAGRAALIAAPAHYADYAKAFARQAGLDAEQARQMVVLLRQQGVDVESISMPTMARRMAQPALFVHSADDRVVPIDDALASVAAWPGARLLRLDGLGHRRILSDPRVVEAVTHFVAAAAAPPTGCLAATAPAPV